MDTQCNLPSAPHMSRMSFELDAAAPAAAFVSVSATSIMKGLLTGALLLLLEAATVEPPADLACFSCVD